MSILERSVSEDKIKQVDGDMMVTSLYTAGIAGERFLRSLQQHGAIIGSYCPTCKKNFLPARLFCERCLTRLSDTKTAPAEGRLKTFTKVYLDLDGQLLVQPRIIGFIEFRGFEGGLIHEISSDDEKKLKIGTKVTPRFLPQEKRKGSILDISCFSVI